MPSQPERSLVQVESTPTGVVVHLVDCQALNEQKALALQAEIDALITRLGTAVRLTMDMGGVGYLTSTALNLFIVLHKNLRAGGGHLTLGGVSPEVYDVFDSTRLTQVLDVRPAGGSPSGDDEGP